MADSFDVVTPQRARCALIAHVPHASTVVPERFRRQMLLDDAALERELVRMTDWHSEDLFAWVLESGGTMFVNRLSRLVLDPERFADDAGESMAKVGQGVVYTRTADGRELARVTARERAARIREVYAPYHAALSAQVALALEEFGECMVLDCHSFATIPLPSEPRQALHRPDVCIGTDAGHTPEALVVGLEEALAREGFRVTRDMPFEGCLVPAEHRGDPRVRAVMIEVRRGLYCDEATGERSADYPRVRESLRRACESAIVGSIATNIDRGDRVVNKGGFSWKRLIGVTRVKSSISRAIGVPLTKSGRQRKIGRIVTGGGCLLPIVFAAAAALGVAAVLASL